MTRLSLNKGVKLTRLSLNTPAKGMEGNITPFLSPDHSHKGFEGVGNE